MAELPAIIANAPRAKMTKRTAKQWREIFAVQGEPGLAAYTNELRGFYRNRGKYKNYDSPAFKASMERMVGIRRGKYNKNVADMAKIRKTFGDNAKALAAMRTTNKVAYAAAKRAGFLLKNPEYANRGEGSIDAVMRDFAAARRAAVMTAQLTRLAKLRDRKLETPYTKGKKIRIHQGHYQRLNLKKAPVGYKLWLSKGEDHYTTARRKGAAHRRAMFRHVYYHTPNDIETYRAAKRARGTGQKRAPANPLTRRITAASWNYDNAVLPQLTDKNISLEKYFSPSYGTRIEKLKNKRKDKATAAGLLRAQIRYMLAHPDQYNMVTRNKARVKPKRTKKGLVVIEPIESPSINLVG